ncbi:hypothetical protein J437_LFUL004227 [Ladona fulva]|uniref:Micro-fibrillar-associated protein 1 C-terminal domain-containing protein n=1 Tax=Ladona fulva TaxID=123851 RepID=A0A8K0JXL6_LADFU|nr:hypothetical protein J437_LFUL004227 [Ladona fulva]
MTSKAGPSIQSTAGAIPVRNEKGEVSMQKVKVHRYVSGKRPDYAPISSSEEESEEEDFIEQQRRHVHHHHHSRGAPDEEVGEVDVDEEDEEIEDRRLRRLKRKEGMQESAADDEDEGLDEGRIERHRHIHAPEVVDEGEEAVEEEEEEAMEIEKSESIEMDNDLESRRRKEIEDEDDEEEEDELSDTEIERRRLALREKLLYEWKVQDEPEVLDKEEDGRISEASEGDSSEDEEYTDRITILEREREAGRLRAAEAEAKKAAEERRKATLKMVEEEIRKEVNEKAGVGVLGSVAAGNLSLGAVGLNALGLAPGSGLAGGPTVGVTTVTTGEDQILASLADVDTDDGADEEAEYEAWKLRELKRIKRDRDEREQMEKERLEVERLRNMTEEERRQEIRLNPKLITNKASKGKYKFLQKYYHRGVFYLDEDDDLYKRDFSAATLDDHFDKTILPKVMQVKNFGRSGRTKYTHLVDQDTTAFDSPWVSDTAQNLKFHSTQAAGMKQNFDRPSVFARRKKPAQGTQQ